MARLHGRNGRLYMGLASGGTAEPVAFLNSWSLSFSTDKADATAFGDNAKVTLNGLPEHTGQFGGFYDDSTVQMYTAATDGVARRFYIYPSTSNNSQYFFGTANFDLQIDESVTDAVKISGNFANASQVGIQKVG